ncbi:hypothetical protein BD289DRAFT_142833 [Coniella lustricola]|uniref:Uncharacterized protein n=1 Tax=Coniella lustricola TaxID=2025994 RepID=A0A2T2ZV98_9PEZI|nr:hypothetical protein BD289DRAFT_142833 [Coniella lustricola]
MPSSLRQLEKAENEAGGGSHDKIDSCADARGSAYVGTVEKSDLCVQAHALPAYCAFPHAGRPDVQCTCSIFLHVLGRGMLWMAYANPPPKISGVGPLSNLASSEVCSCKRSISIPGYLQHRQKQTAAAAAAAAVQRPSMSGFYSHIQVQRVKVRGRDLCPLFWNAWAPLSCGPSQDCCMSIFRLLRPCLGACTLASTTGIDWAAPRKEESPIVGCGKTMWEE